MKKTLAITLILALFLALVNMPLRRKTAGTAPTNSTSIRSNVWARK